MLRRALALALHPGPASAEDVQDCLRLAESVDEAAHEGVRLRAFLVADLARYRAALPGTAAGFLTLLEEALSCRLPPEPGRPRRPAGPAGEPGRRRPPGPLPAARRAGRTGPAGRQGGRAGRRPHRRCPPPGPACWPCPAVSPPRSRPGSRGRSPRRSSRTSGPHPPPGPHPTPPSPAAPSPPRARSSRAAGRPRPRIPHNSSPQAEPQPAELDRRPGPPPGPFFGPGYSGPMDYVSALVPPVVMAVALHRCDRDDGEESGRCQQGQGGRRRRRHPRPGRADPAGRTGPPRSRR